jgi:hypothetical protein
MEAPDYGEIIARTLDADHRWEEPIVGSLAARIFHVALFAAALGAVRLARAQGAHLTMQEWATALDDGFCLEVNGRRVDFGRRLAGAAVTIHRSGFPRGPLGWPRAEEKVVPPRDNEQIHALAREQIGHAVRLLFTGLR